MSSHPGKPHKTYELTSRQLYNVILASRGEGKCEKAKRFVKNLDAKYNLKGRR